MNKTIISQILLIIVVISLAIGSFYIKFVEDSEVISMRFVVTKSGKNALIKFICPICEAEFEGRIGSIFDHEGNPMIKIETCGMLRYEKAFDIQIRYRAECPECGSIALGRKADVPMIYDEDAEEIVTPSGSGGGPIEE